MRALIVVDVQNDFCPGGTLPVPQGDMVVPRINRLIPRHEVVAFTQDWHPPDHISFDEGPRFEDGSWPVHCVRDTPGAELHEDLVIPEDAIRIRKGTDSTKEAYSGFQGTDLAEQLRARGVTSVKVVGLALDYCVKATAIDAAKAGFDTTVEIDACRAVAPEHAMFAVQEMLRFGVKVPPLAS